jgi:hypothetical protein
MRRVQTEREVLQRRNECLGADRLSIAAHSVPGARGGPRPGAACSCVEQVEPAGVEWHACSRHDLPVEVQANALRGADLHFHAAADAVHDRRAVVHQGGAHHRPNRSVRGPTP